MKSHKKVKLKAKKKFLAELDTLKSINTNTIYHTDNPISGAGCGIIDVDGKGKGTGKCRWRKNERMATLMHKSHFYNPMRLIGKNIEEALDPARAPSKPRTLKDMSPEERKRLEEKYGVPVR